MSARPQRSGRTGDGGGAYLIAGQIEDLEIGGFLGQLRQVIQLVQLVAGEIQ